MEQVSEDQSAQPPVQSPEQPQKSPPKFLFILLGVIAVLGLTYGAYYLGQQKATLTPTPTPIQTLSSPTPTIDPTSNWKTQTIKTVNMEFKLPSQFDNLILEEKVRQGGDSGKVFTLLPNISNNGYSLALGGTSRDFVEGRGGSFIDLQGYKYENGKYYALFVSDKTIELPTNLVREITNPNGVKILRIIGTNHPDSEAEGLPLAGTPGEGLIGALINTNESTFPGLAFQMKLKENLTEDIFDQILSTFKFTDQVNSPSLTPVTQNYPRPANWKTLNLSSIGISVCTPQDWQTENGSTIVYNRDPGYKPDVATVRVLDYKGGSKREEYINERLQYEEFATKLKSETKVEELTVGDKEILYITIPSFPDAVVFVLGNKLYAFELSSWNLINDSQSAFLKDIYTMINCVKKI